MSTTPPLSPSSTSSSTRSLSPDLSSSALLRHRHRYRHYRHGRSASAASTARGVAFASAILSSLCAGSIAVFSLYGHIFQERLRYSQFQVNGVAIAASIACYLPVSLLGYVCDRAGPAPLSLLSSVLFSVGYGTAAVLYKREATEATASAGVRPAGPTPGAYAAMVAAFVAIGVATCAMYLGSVATCAKNFGRGRHRGLALAAPIAAFGLSGMWQSQFGSRVLYERLPPPPSAPPGTPPGRGDLDVFAFFLFLAVLLFVVGLVGTFTLRVVDEEKLIDDAVDELERSGFLDGSGLFFPTATSAETSASTQAPADRYPSPPDWADHSAAAGRSTRFGPGVTGGNNSGDSSGTGGYGTIGRANPFDQGHTEDEDEDDNNNENGLRTETSSLLQHNKKTSGRRTRRRWHGQGAGEQEADGDNEHDALASRLLDPSKDDDDDNDDDEDADDEQARVKKAWVLNAETRRFLSDHTMWLLTLAFFLMMGPSETFINNMGTVIQTLYPREASVSGPPPTTAATHVSIFGLTSTVARLVTGSLTDLLAPQPQTPHLQVDADEGEEEESSPHGTPGDRFTVSRVVLLLAAALLLLAGLVVLASGAVQNHGADRFWLVSGLVGAGYGAVFSLTPIMITVIWGVENFGTNWGIVAMFPALGATLWGLVYSAVYQRGVGNPEGGDRGGDSNLCYGTQCYAPTFWAMSGSVWLACVLVVVAWKGRRGWAQRGIVI